MIMSGYVYNCSSGDTFDIISLAAYGNEKYAADIMICNPKYLDTLVFNGGEKILLPEVDIPEVTGNVQYVADKAPWKE